MSDLWGIAWLVVLILVNAFFVASEFAVIAAQHSRIEPRAASGSRFARTALWAMEHATLMLAACQLGVTVCSLLILGLSEPAIRHLLQGPLGLTGWPDAVVEGVVFAIALIVVSFLHVVFGEMVPRNLSFAAPDRAVLMLATPLVAVATVLRPIVAALNGLTNGVLRLFGVRPKTETTSAYTIDEVATIVATSTREGLLEDTTGAVTNTIQFTDKQAGDLAVALDQIVALTAPVTPKDVEAAVARHGYSRYLLLGPDGQPSGYVHLKDVLDLDDAHFDEPVPASKMHALLAFAPGLPLEDALDELREHSAHLALVAADGAADGVLFLEDILEELVGEVEDAARRGTGSGSPS